MPEVACHFRPAQIQVAIFQSQFLIHFAGDLGIIDGEWQNICNVQHLQRSNSNFDLTRRDFGIIRAGGTRADFARDADDTLAAERGRLIEKVFRQIRRIENGLRAPFAVADINKNEAAQIAA